MLLNSVYQVNRKALIWNQNQQAKQYTFNTDKETDRVFWKNLLTTVAQSMQNISLICDCTKFWKLLSYTDT